MVSTKTIKIMFTLLLLSWLCAWSVCGYAMTTTETSQSITIPITEWTDWKNDWMTLDNELTACKKELSRIRKPSNELLEQLQQAEKMLKLLQTDLEKQSEDLTTLSRQVDESKTELKKLREQIDKERRIHRRQIWQNRLWCILGGTAVGIAIGHASK